MDVNANNLPLITETNCASTSETPHLLEEGHSFEHYTYALVNRTTCTYKYPHMHTYPKGHMKTSKVEY